MNQYHSALLRVALPAICLVFIANSATLAQDGTTENESPLAAKDDSAGTGFFLGYLSGRPDSINYKLFTHICHAFVVADEDGRIVARASVPSKKLTTEAHQAKVKVILSLGGWGMDEEFAALTAKEEAYERFVTAVMKIVDEYDYDGIDLDWEFPDNPTEAKNFNRLARRFRRDLNALGKAKDRHFLLTMAVNASPGLSKWLDTQVLLENMDFINVMTYDFFGSWSKRAGHHTALFESSKAKGVSTQKAMTYWHQDKGIPKERLLVGLPLYSRGFAAAQPFDKVNRNAPRAYQALAYRDLQQLIQDGWKYAWDDETQNPWLTSPKGDYVHSYDNERSLALKTGWALQQGYRGVFFWEIKQDRLKDGSNPLLEASRKALDHEQSGSDAPYSPSKIITKLTWSPNVKKMKGYAHGDNWPIAWIDDGPQITAFCDGRGFTEQAPDLSLGFAEVFGDPPDFQAQNFKSTADTPVGWGSKGIKASDMIMVDGVLYMFVRNYQAPGSEDFTNARLACSKDLGRTWNWAPWHFSDTFGCPAFVQFGKNYTGARDAYVYIASQANDSAYGYSPDIVMARVKKDSVMDRGRYTFIAGYDENGRPRWSPDISRRVPIFTDPKGTQRIALTHNAGIDRYILTTSHLTTNKQATHTAALGVFEAPEPWGPWSTVYYDDHWSTAQGKDCRTYHHRFPPKWTSTDGKTMYLLYSGLDCDLYSFCVKQATLEVARGEALVFEPEAGVSGKRHVWRGGRQQIPGRGKGRTLRSGRRRCVLHAALA